MAIQELQNFRTKYPQYSDMSDTDLANKLAAKYPQYSDLLGKVQPDSIQKNIQSGQNPVEATLGYVGQHPFKTIFQGLPQTISGKTVADNVIDNSPKTPFTKEQVEIYKKQWGEYPSTYNQLNVGDRFKAMAGSVVDMATAPGNLLIGPAIKSIGAGGAIIAQGATNVGRFAKNLIVGPEEALNAANEAKFSLGQQTADQIANTQRIGKAKINIAKNNADAVSQGYDDLTTTLQKQVSRYGDQQGLEIQKNLPKIFAQKSKEYATEQENILNNLSEERKQIPVQSVVNNMEKTLIKFKILKNDGNGQLLVTDAELTPTEQKVLGIYKDLKKSTEPITSQSPILGENGQPIENITNPSQGINVEDLLKNQKYIEPEYGKGWQPDDKLRAEIAKGFSDSVTKAVPELQVLKGKYAPFLKWKEAAIDKLKPFNNQYDVATGTVVKSGSPVINPSEQRLMAKLQDIYQSQSGNRLTALNKGINQTAMNKEQAQQAAKETIQKLRNDLAKDISEIRKNKSLGSQNIDAITNKLIKKYTLQRIGVGAIGAGITSVGAKKSLEFFIRGHVSSK